MNSLGDSNKHPHLNLPPSKGEETTLFVWSSFERKSVRLTRKLNSTRANEVNKSKRPTLRQIFPQLLIFGIIGFFPPQPIQGFDNFLLADL
jgi:hypothetical protein